MDTGKELIEDKNIKAQIRRQARMVYVKSLALAIALTSVCLLLTV